MLRRIALIVFSIIAIVLLAVAGLLVYLYRNQQAVADLVLRELNDMQRGHTTLKHVYVNPYTNFPYVSIDLRGLAFYAQKGDREPIYAFDDVYLGFNLWNVLAGDYTIKRIYIKKGQLNLIKNEQGEYNLLLAKSPRQKSQEKGGKIHLDLRRLVIEQVRITKRDMAAQSYLAIDLAQMTTSLSYIKDIIKNELDAKFTVSELSSEGVPLFRNKHLHINSSLNYDLTKNLVEIAPSTLEIEQGEFKLQGSVDLNRNAYTDIRVEGRKPDFKLITAFAPEYVYQRLQNYKNKGDIYFRGTIQGEAINAMPKIDLEFGCKNAQFINPSQKNSIRDLNFAGFFTNGSKRDLTTCELYIKSLSGKPEESVFKGSFHIKNFYTPYISLDFHSKLDLSTLKNFFEISSLKTLKGWLTIDMTVDELLDYNDVPTTLGKLKDGTDSRLVLRDVQYQPQGMDYAIKDLNGELQLVAGKLILKDLYAKLKDSDFRLQGNISNLASYFHKRDTTVEANLSLKSSLMDLKQLAGIDEQIKDLQLDLSFLTTVDYLHAPGIIPQGEFWVRDLNMRLKNYPHAIHDTHVDLLLDSSQIAIKKLETVIDKSDIHFLGSVKNYRALLSPKRAAEMIDAQIKVLANELRLEDLLVYRGQNMMPQDYQHEIVRGLHLETQCRIAAADLLKANLWHNTQLKLQRLDAQLLLHPLAFREVSGNFMMQDDLLRIEDFRAKMGRSDFSLSGQVERVSQAAKMGSKKRLNFAANVLDLDELLSLPQTSTSSNPNNTAPVNHDSGFNLFTLPFPEVQWDMTIGELKYQKYKLNNLTGKLRTTPNHYLYIDQLAMLTAGGKVEMDGYFNGSDKSKIYLKSNLRLAELDLDKVFYKFDNFGQDYLVSNNLHGKLSGTIRANVRLHTDLTPNLQDTEAHIEANVKSGSIVNFAPMRAMSSFFADKDLDNIRFAEMSNVFDYKNGAITFPKMEIATTLGYIFISGSQSLDTRMDFDVQIPLRLVKQATWDYLFRRKRERKRNQEDQADDEVVEDIISAKEKNYKTFVNVNIKGTPSDYKIKLGRRKK